MANVFGDEPWVAVFFDEAEVGVELSVVECDDVCVHGVVS